MNKATISIIAAIAANGVIGRDGRLPWPIIRGELDYFRKTTLGHPVIMGRKTWDSLHKHPLPGRDNIVITSDREFKHPAAYTARGLTEAIGAGRLCSEITAQLTKNARQEIFIIGGGFVFAQCMKSPTWSKIDRIYISRIQQVYGGDCYFKPDLTASEWRENHTGSLVAAEGFPAVEFYTYTRRGSAADG